MRSACRRFACLLPAACLAVVAGCALFDQGAALFYRTAAKPLSGRNPLPPIQTSRDAMELVIVFAERPVGDRLLGPALWQEIDQVGSVSADDRASLAQFGLRVGNAGSSMCPELERLLDLSTKPVDKLSGRDSHAMTGRKSFVLAGSEDLIPISPIKLCNMKLPTQGEETREYRDATGVLRMWVHRVQDGWARLEFQPEIHHGASTMRTVAEKGGFATVFSRDIDPFPSGRFSVNLHEGEMAIITADGNDRQSLGSCCFITGDDNRKVQRVLVVRLSKMARSEAVYGK